MNSEVVLTGDVPLVPAVLTRVLDLLVALLLRPLRLLVFLLQMPLRVLTFSISCVGGFRVVLILRSLILPVPRFCRGHFLKLPTRLLISVWALQN